MPSELQYLQLQSQVNLAKTIAAIRHFSVLPSPPILIKGWSLARFYPEANRTYSDIDLVVDPDLEEAARELYSRFDFPGTVIDLHVGMRTLDTVAWSTLLERSYTVDVDGVSIRVLADEDNLRVTAVHWLTDGGVNRERLRDILYLVENRKEGFDWQACLASGGPVRKTWVISAIAAARDHLGLDVSKLPDEIRSFRLPNWYQKTIEKEWKRGPYIRRVMSSLITRPKLLAEQMVRRFPPNRIAATIDAEMPIDNSSPIPAQIRSLTKKIGPFARGLGRRLTYKRQKHVR